MSVLKLRRDMVVVEEPPAEEPASARAVSEIEKPFPLRKIVREDEDLIEAELTEQPEEPEHHERHQKTFFEHVRFWFNSVAIVAALAAYPAMVVAASDVGDGQLAGVVDRAEWAAPWTGGAAALMQQHVEHLGWASDAQAWEPMARLTAKPAFQSALAASLGAVVKLQNDQAIASGRADADLEAAARLISADASGVQLSAARDALVNYDARLKRRDVDVAVRPEQVAAQLMMFNGWASESQAAIRATAASVGGSPMDEDATRAVYAAKGRAMVAFTMLEALDRPKGAEAAAARDRAADAWKKVAQFHPLVVLNGDPDGSVFGNHPAAVGYLLTQAEAATAAFAAVVSPAAGQLAAAAAVNSVGPVAN